VTTLVIDASIAVKWVVEEDGTAEALTLRRRAKLIAPELLTAECANILWKKVQRDELSKDEALLAARLLQAADIEFLPTRTLLEAATQIAIELNHAAYDCFYLVLATERDCRLVTADERFVRKLSEAGRRRFRGRVISLGQAARELDKRNREKSNRNE
jgi:predicted nucleic acid-binding protein